MTRDCGHSRKKASQHWTLFCVSQTFCFWWSFYTSDVSTEELTRKNRIFLTLKNSRSTICTFSLSRLGVFLFSFFPQTFNNHSRCSRAHSSRLCFRGWIQPTVVSVHVPVLSWRILPALTSLCRGRPDAVSWWGSASECRLNTADLQPGRRGLGLACSLDHLPKLFVKSLSPALLNRVLKVLSSLTNVSVDDGLLWPGLRHHLPPETKMIASQESTETNYKLMENVKIELRWLYLERNLATIDFVFLTLTF